MNRQPIFNAMPFPVALLTGAIVLAHVGRIIAPDGVQETIVETLAIFPQRWEAAYANGDLAALLPSMFGHVLVHANWLHLAFNMTLFVSVGRGLAQRLGGAPGASARFLLIFFGSAAAAALAFVAIDRGSTVPAFGASGAVCGIYSAFLMSVRGDWRASLRDPFVLQNGAIFVGLNVVLAFFARQWGVLPIAWEAHLGGFIGGMVIYPLVAPPPVRVTPD